jgi:hypothetical protein
MWLASKADASPPGSTLAIGDGKIAPTKWGNQNGIAGPLPFANGLDCHVFAARRPLASRPDGGANEAWRAMREVVRKVPVTAACLAAFLLLGLARPALAEKPLGIALAGFAYPYPVHMFVIQADGERLSKAYMDVPPEGDSYAEHRRQQRAEN